MGGKLAHRPHSEGSDQEFLLRLAVCHEWSIPGINTGPHTVQHLYKCTLTKFMEDTKLGSKVDMSGGRVILQTDLDRLEEWASKNCMFNKDKSKAPHLG